ncbi:DNA-binding LacI/PurR family transcriptional regulator [Microbacterium sp. BE35]|uniref:LacI family DNA-binding transcriptional regulator n=1 Tax=Microbacterium sp. BE35 TaxID=2817773 RepID=UPI00286358CF|nr:LacI family DNA-binding transcriptional regulator [Microbacterium sp. BE35]MDR7187404.1 DNA-binding LacI/PurR family transcriptional regulator [Microbacterium sp. BE35]
MPVATEATLEDVARAAGVSQSTASRVLNGSTRRVRPENERLVRDAALRLGYAVDLRAQATARRLSDTVAIVVESLLDTVVMDVATRIHRSAQRDGCAATVNVCALDDERAADDILRLRGQRPRSIFVVMPAGGVLHPAVMRELARYGEHGGTTVIVERADARAADRPG